MSCACANLPLVGLLPEHSVSVKGTQTKTTQVNICMATVEHDRQGQAAHRRYKLCTVVEFARSEGPCIIDTNKHQRFSS